MQNVAALLLQEDCRRRINESIAPADTCPAFEAPFFSEMRFCMEFGLCTGVFHRTHLIVRVGEAQVEASIRFQVFGSDFPPRPRSFPSPWSR